MLRPPEGGTAIYFLYLTGVQIHLSLKPRWIDCFHGFFFLRLFHTLSFVCRFPPVNVTTTCSVVTCQTAVVEEMFIKQSEMVGVRILSLLRWNGSAPCYLTGPIHHFCYMVLKYVFQLLLSIL